MTSADAVATPTPPAPMTPTRGPPCAAEPNGAPSRNAPAIVSEPTCARQPAVDRLQECGSASADRCGVRNGPVTGCRTAPLRSPVSPASKSSRSRTASVPPSGRAARPLGPRRGLRDRGDPRDRLPEPAHREQRQQRQQVGEHHVDLGTVSSSTLPALASAAGKPCVAVAGPLPAGAPVVPVRSARRRPSSSPRTSKRARVRP